MRSLKVASLNIGGLPTFSPPLAARAVEFGRRLDESDVDVLNIQEAWFHGSLAALRQHLPSYRFVAWRRGLPGPAGGLVTFSRLPLGRVSYRSYLGVVPAGGGRRFRARRALNSALQGVLTVELAGRGIVVVNTHLTANKDGDWTATNRYFDFQRAQLGRLHRVLRRTTGARLVIVSGDFNIASAGPLYSIITGDGAWHDAFADDQTPTFHAEFLPPGSTGHRIDYLLVSDGTRFPIVERALLFTEPMTLANGERMYATDHIGLTARVSLTDL